MELAGEALLRATPERVWAALGDRGLLDRLLPAGSGLQPVGPGEFVGTIAFGTPPMVRRHDARARVSKDGDTFRVEVVGTGRSSGLSLDMECVLAPGPVGESTAVRYSLRADLGGLSAWVGAGVAKGLVAGFFRSFDAALAGEGGPGAG